MPPWGGPGLAAGSPETGLLRTSLLGRPWLLGAWGRCAGFGVGEAGPRPREVPGLAPLCKARTCAVTQGSCALGQSRAGVSHRPDATPRCDALGLRFAQRSLPEAFFKVAQG